MNKFYFLIVSILITCSAFSQAYKPMLKENKTWDVDYYPHVLVFLDPYCVGHSRAFLKGDTIISGKRYSKLNYNNLAQQCIPAPGGGYSPSIYDTTFLFSNILMREDTITRKVWARHVGDSLDYLIYDFSVNVGDTMFSSACFFWYSNNCQNSIFHKVLIDSIGTTTLSNGELTRIFHGTPLNFTTLSHFPFSVIEGVGGPDGFIAPFEDEFEGDRNLTCVKDSHDVIFNESGNCGYMVGINENSKSTPQLYIYPNPTLGKNLNISGNGLKTITIYNIHGQLIKTTNVENDEIELNLETNPKGIYLVKALFKNGAIATQKLILTR